MTMDDRKGTGRRRKGSNRDVKRILKVLRKLGWTIHQTQAGHFKARSPKPDVPIVIIPQSPSDYFALKNLRALLKRHGVEV